MTCTYPKTNGITVTKWAADKVTLSIGFGRRADRDTAATAVRNAGLMSASERSVALSSGAIDAVRSFSEGLMAITSYIGPPEDESGYWDDKYPEDEEEYPELLEQIREVFVLRGWIIPQTESEVAMVEEEPDIEW